MLGSCHMRLVVTILDSAERVLQNDDTVLYEKPD